MDDKMKLTGRLNRGNMLVNFWVGVSNTAIRLSVFATTNAMKVLKKNVEIAKQLSDSQVEKEELDKMFDKFKTMES